MSARKIELQSEEDRRAEEAFIYSVPKEFHIIKM
jgi:hypothetical protein